MAELRALLAASTGSVPPGTITATVGLSPNATPFPTNPNRSYPTYLADPAGPFGVFAIYDTSGAPNTLQFVGNLPKGLTVSGSEPPKTVYLPFASSASPVSDVTVNISPAGTRRSLALSFR